MNEIRAINKRVSRRRFISKELDLDTKLVITDLIKLYNTISGMSSFLLEDGSLAFDSFKHSFGIFSNVKSVIVLKGLASDSHLKEKTGYYGQKLVIKCMQLNLGSCWVSYTYNKNLDLFQLNDNEVIYSIIPIGYVNPKLDIKEYLFKKVFYFKNRTATDYLLVKENFDLLPDFAKLGLKGISKAPSSFNLNRVKLSIENKKIKISVSDKLKYDLVDLGIAKANFELAANNGSFSLGNNAYFNKR